MNQEENKRKKQFKKISLAFLFGTLASTIIFLLKRNLIFSLVSFFVVSSLFLIYIYFKKSLKETARIKRIESVFPDFLQLMSSNLRAGMTIDKAMLLSSREEFNPLDKEIFQTGKEIATGEEIESALKNMAKRIGSKKIDKIILLIISGIKAGGDLAVLLESTSTSMRERDFVEKKAASNVLMYLIFIFVAVSLGAPALFALSTVLVNVLATLTGGLPSAGQSAINLPFTLSQVNVSVTFVKYFSVVFIISINILASLILGLVSKGDEKQGLRYLPLMIAMGLGVFFGVITLLSSFLSGFF